MTSLLISVLPLMGLGYLELFFTTKKNKKVQFCRSEVFLVKGVLKICSKFTGEYPCRSVISMKLLCSFTEITLRHGCCPVNLLHIFRTPFTKKISGWLLLISFSLEIRSSFAGLFLAENILLVDYI